MEACPVATDSALLPAESAESLAKPLTRRPALPTPAPDCRIKKQGAFYHLSDKEEAPWKAPGGRNPRPDGTHPTRGVSTPGWPASRPPPSIHPPVSRSGVTDVRNDGNRLPKRNLLSPFQLAAPRGSQPSHSLPAPPLPQADGAPTLPLREAGAITSALPTQAVSTPHRYSLFGEGTLVGISLFPPPQYTVLGPGFSPPPSRLPIMAPTTPATPSQSPKRKREYTGDAVDGDEALDKKRARRAPSDVD